MHNDEGKLLPTSRTATSLQLSSFLSPHTTARIADDAGDTLSIIVVWEVVRSIGLALRGLLWLWTVTTACDCLKCFVCNCVCARMRVCV